MTRTYREVFVRLSAAAVLLLLIGLSGPLSAQSGGVVTAPGSYSDPAWQALASKYQANLGRVQSGINSKLGHRPFKLLTTADSTVGGIGLWANPVSYDESNRYLCVFARMSLPTSSPFPNTDSGRVLQVMDAYGKDTIYIIASELKNMNEPSIAGAALIFIYGKGDPNSPGFEQSAEAMALFIPRNSVMTFASLQMTIQSLFSSSTILPIFKGPQIASLRQGLISP